MIEMIIRRSREFCLLSSIYLSDIRVAVTDILKTNSSKIACIHFFYGISVLQTAFWGIIEQRQTQKILRKCRSYWNEMID